MGWLTQFFMHPAMVPIGAALVASPIIIHLINRMRFRRVRFAAMEFLLASQQRNRRRLLIEQLVLLALRILIVLLLLALIARLVLDPSLSVFDKGKAHHVVILDDSLSMRERIGDTTAFDRGLDVVKELVQRGAEHPQTQTLTLLLLSDPDNAVERERDVNNQLVTELESKLGALRCTHQALDIVAGLEAAGKLFEDDPARIKHLHVVSDFRRVNWEGQKAIGQTVAELDKAGVAVNLVKCVRDPARNLAVTQFAADSKVAAAGISLGLTIGVTNFGTTVADDVRLSIYAGGQKLPLSATFDNIEAGQEAVQTKYVTFERAGTHQMRIVLDEDPLSEDNQRFLAVNIPPSNPVLIVTSDVNGDSAFVVSSALSDVATTGNAALVENVDFLRRNPLSRFRSVFLLNVPELPPDALAPLKRYVRDGGGLVWFLGDAVKPAFYTEVLHENGQGLFPVPLELAPRELTHDGSAAAPLDLVVKEDHPVFGATAASVRSLLDDVRVDHWIPVADTWRRDDNARRDGVSTLATLRGREPLVFEHQYGTGSVVTFLTSAGPDWTNWHENNYSFPLVILDMQRHIARENQASERRTVGQPIEVTLDPATYADAMTLVPPGEGETHAFEIKLETRSPARANDAAAGASTNANPASVRFASYTDTDTPGIYVYSVKALDPALPDLERFLAYNTPVEESDLTPAADTTIREAVGENVRVEIRDAGQLDWIEATNPGQEVRRMVLIFLVAFLLLEQFLAYTFSYHPQRAGASA
ncbi:MAG TPA: BatA domain-containing protein [Planctomycetaceae bacterium]|nr:BatA domain-containing protein [Planctomycetaceae bacterium]